MAHTARARGARSIESLAPNEARQAAATHESYVTVRARQRLLEGERSTAALKTRRNAAKLKYVFSRFFCRLCLSTYPSANRSKDAAQSHIRPGKIQRRKQEERRETTWWLGLWPTYARVPVLTERQRPRRLV